MVCVILWHLPAYETKSPCTLWKVGASEDSREELEGNFNGLHYQPACITLLQLNTHSGGQIDKAGALCSDPQIAQCIGPGSIVHHQHLQTAWISIIHCVWLRFGLCFWVLEGFNGSTMGSAKSINCVSPPDRQCKQGNSLLGVEQCQKPRYV